MKIMELKKEPWVRLATEKDLRNWSHEDEVRYNQANRQAEKLGFFVKAFDFLADNKIEGDYHEYGCHRVRTFRMALTEARRHQACERMKFFAFDSFAGLPQVESDPSTPVWKKGALATSEEQFTDLIQKHGIFVDRVRTIKGFYRDSLTKTLQKQFVRKEAKIALATIDCDLYESATTVFRFIEPLLQEGSLLYLDDLFAGYKGLPTKGVFRAFREYQQRSRFKFVEHMQVSWWGRSYIACLES